MRIAITGGRVLAPEGGLVEAPVLFDEDGIVAVGEGGEGTGGAALVVDAGGGYVLPGIVDLHGDAFERQLMPRPGVFFPMDVALLETDRQMLANGITTAFHGLTWSWEPGLRGTEAARSFLAGLEAARPHLACDTRLHLRHECFNLDAEAEVIDWIGAGRVALLAFNDHVADIRADAAKPQKLARYADRCGIGTDAFLALLARVEARADEVSGSVERIAAAARAAGVPMASHDDASPDMRRRMRALGCAISEFPVDVATAADAIAHGEAVVLGAPNVLRGGSHAGRLGAADAIGDGLCSVLTSDYYYPALPAAMLRLARGDASRLAALWPMVSTNAARTAGLDDRGRIAPGQRADLLVLRDAGPGGRIDFVAVAGRPALRRDV